MRVVRCTPFLLKMSQICGRGDTVEALSHVLAQQRRATTGPRTAVVSSVAPGTGQQHSHENDVLSPPPQPLSEDDLVKIKAAVRDRDAPKRSIVLPSPPISGGGAAVGGGGGNESSPAAAIPTPPFPSSPSRWSSTSGGVDSKGESVAAAAGGIDQRLFAPVLRAILAGEGDHVLRRSLLCHPFLKAAKSGASSSGGGSSWGGSVVKGGSPTRGGGGGGGGGSGGGSDSGKAVAPSPRGRRRGSKGAKGGKAKKRDRDRERDQEEVGQAASPSTGASARGGVDRSSPLDASREMNRLATRAAADGSLQSTLILVKTLLCAVDPGTQASSVTDSPRHSEGGRGAGAGRTQASMGGAAAASGRGVAGGKGPATGGVYGAARSISGELKLRTAPLRALAGRGLSGWSEVTELLRREKYRERMAALRGRPSLTVCSGKADTRGRLVARGESSGVVTGLQVRQGAVVSGRGRRDGGCLGVRAIFFCHVQCE